MGSRTRATRIDGSVFIAAREETVKGRVTRTGKGRKGIRMMMLVSKFVRLIRGGACTPALVAMKIKGFNPPKQNVFQSNATVLEA